ncbi:MAG: hypothetical protein SGBAC_010347 [Bacillariaceae sp.]
MEDPMVAPSSLTVSPATVLTEICNAQLPKSQTDAATNTDSSTDCNDGELKVSIRLGGILPSDDEEEDTTNDQSLDAGPASPLTTIETGKSNASLRSQIDILQKIASMESREYHQRLVENSVDTAALEDRSLVQISQSVHRFHSVILNLNEENDGQTQEILRLQAKDMDAQNKIARLEAAVSKLLAQKQKLRNKNRAGKSVNRKLVEHLQNFSNAAQQEEETIGRLLQHEQNLRERCDSASNFSSDLEGFDTESVYSMASNRSLVTSEPPTVRFHRERNLTWPHSDFGDDDAGEEAFAKDTKGASADYHSKSPKERANSGTTTTKTTTTTDAADPSRKVSEGGKSVSNADIWKASMRPRATSPMNSNFWNNSMSIGSTASKDHDPLHKVDRSTILDLGEHDDIGDLRRRKNENQQRQSKTQHESSKNKKKDSGAEPAFVHDFKVMFGTTPQKRKSSSGEKFDLLNLFKKEDANKDKSSSNETNLLPKRSSAMAPTPKTKDLAKSEKDSSDRLTKSSPSKTNKRESKTSIVLENAKHEAQEATDKFKSSMKNMGKMFNFMDKH